MAKVMKPSQNFKDETNTGAAFYDGPPPPAGVYQGKVAKIFRSVVKDGEKKGEVRYLVICNVDQEGSKYNGASTSKWMQETKQGAPWINQFLRSLTDGSQAQFDGIRKAWWEDGYEVDDSKDVKGMFAITKIGKRTNPVGLKCTFMTKVREGRSEITRFISKVSDDDGQESAETESSSPEEDLLSSVEDSEPSFDSSESSSDSDSDGEADIIDLNGEDDPWSVGG